MRTSLRLTALLCLAFSSGANAQQLQATESPVLVYHNDDSVKPPRLLPTDFSSLVADHCKGEASAIVVLDLVVDGSGKPQNIDALNSFNDGLERMAVAVAKMDHFKPAIKDGSPVAVAAELHVSLSICAVEVPDENGNLAPRLRLKLKPEQTLLPASKSPPSTVSFSLDGQFKQPDSPGLYRVGGGVSAPIPIERLPQQCRRAAEIRESARSPSSSTKMDCPKISAWFAGSPNRLIRQPSTRCRTTDSNLP